MRAHSSQSSIFLAIRKKYSFLILSLESITSFPKNLNLFKVAYHPVSCLLYLNIYCLPQGYRKCIFEIYHRLLCLDSG